jgi:trehalose-6-phosphate synthase
MPQVREINERFGTPGWRPIHLVKQSLDVDRLAVLYRLADVCIVSSLQDGMNLVAKEFVASQVDRNGVLLLSRFAGAAEEMEDATLINPYDPEACAVAVRDALALPADERAASMQRLQASLTTIYDWMHDMFTAWGAIVAGNPILSSRPPADEDDEDLLDDEMFAGTPGRRAGS